MPKKTQKTPAPKPAVEPRPMTEAEKERYEAFLNRRHNTPYAVKFVEGASGKGSITQDPSVDDKNTLAGLTTATGSVDGDFCHRLLNQVANSSTMGGLETPAHVNAIAAAMTGLAPQSELEGMLAAQMVACHNAAMECLRRACVKDQTFEGRKMNMTYADRFMRTFAVQVEALGKHRKGGQQKVVVEHVHVYPGGQAIVGNVNQGGGNKDGNDGSTSCQHVIDHSPQAVPLRLGDGQEVLCPVQENGRAMPATGHAQR